MKKYLKIKPIIAFVGALLFISGLFCVNLFKRPVKAASGMEYIDENIEIRYEMGANELTYRITTYITQQAINNLTAYYAPAEFYFTLYITTSGTTQQQLINTFNTSTGWQNTVNIGGSNVDDPFYPDATYYWSRSSSAGLGGNINLFTTYCSWYVVVSNNIDNRTYQTISVNNSSDLGGGSQYYWNEGYRVGWDEGYARGAEATQEEAFEAGRLQGIEEGKVIKDEEWNTTATTWITAFLGAISGFFAIKIGAVSIGTLVMIPLTITLAWFIIRMFRGGGSS